MKVISADEDSLTLGGVRFTYLIIEGEETVSLWVQRPEMEKSIFLLSADNDGEGWKSVFAAAREYEARGFHFQPPE